MEEERKTKRESSFLLLFIPKAAADRALGEFLAEIMTK
jgi:hypothetical protein